MFNVESMPIGKSMGKKRTSEEVNKVYKTNDLTIFNVIRGNRSPNPNHVRRLTESIRVNGMMCNPILVNELLQVIDGQHRLLAAGHAKSHIYYIIVKGYKIKEVQTLNLNQKNWTKRDFMNGYADMGKSSYIKLQEFVENNGDFTFITCMALCQNTPTGDGRTLAIQTAKKGSKLNGNAQIFENGTWKCGDIKVAQKNADKIRSIKPFYSGYNRGTFVSAMIRLLNKKEFSYDQFMRKLKIQPLALQDCASTSQYRMLIEEIYNYKSREKVNLRY